MAEMKDPRGKQPAARKRDPVFSHSPEADMAAGGESVPAVLRRPATKAKKKSWFQENRVLVIGASAGVGALAIVLVLCFALGVFSSAGGPKPNMTPVAAQPAAPQAPAAPAAPPSQSTSSQPPPGQAAPSQPTPSQATSTTTPQGGGFGSGATQPAPSAQSPSPGQPTASGATTPETAKKDEPKKKPKPLVPDDVAKWKLDDYKLARHDNHPKLLDAIVRLGEKKYVGNEKAAQCLVDLLKPLPPEKPATGATATASPAPVMPLSPQPQRRGGLPPPSFSGGAATAPPLSSGVNPTPTDVGPRPYTPGDLTKLVETIIETLGCNGSGLARKTFEQVLAGTFATDDDKTAVEATLKTLLAHPSDQGDTLLLRAMTAAKDLRSADRQGPWPAKELEAKTFELVKQSASIGFRTKLAEIALQKHAKLDPKASDVEFLMLANPLNCGAQLLFYTKGDPKKNRELRTTLEQQFVGYSSLALASYLGIPAENISGAPGMSLAPVGGGFNGPPNPRGGHGGFGGGPSPLSAPAAAARPGDSAKTAETGLAPALAGQLWSDDFRKLIETQVADLRLLEKQPQLVVLAATIPQDSTRAVLYKLLHNNNGKRWYDGPKALETAGLLDRVTTDPGLLPLIKMSGKRKESATTPRAVDPATARRGGRSPAPAGGGAKNEAAQKKQQAEQEWMDVSAKLAAGWCKRFAAAASAKDVSESSEKGSGDAAEFKMPSGLELPSTAKIAASHRVVLPGPAPTNFSQVQPSTLEVYYVRVEESAKPSKANQVYTRLATARKSDTRTFDGKTWIESGKLTPQKDRYRSIDVLITRPQGIVTPVTPEKGRGKAVEEDEVDLTIEILIIEIKDPTKDISREPAKEKEAAKESETE